MILADSSALVEFLRGTGSPASVAVREGLKRDELAVCDVVRMELLAGAIDEWEFRRVSDLLDRVDHVAIVATDYDDAAMLYRECRRTGETVRKLVDCLIAAVAVRIESPVLHRDSDFDVLARHTSVQSYQLT